LRVSKGFMTHFTVKIIKKSTLIILTTISAYLVGCGDETTISSRYELKEGKDGAIFRLDKVSGNVHLVTQNGTFEISHYPQPINNNLKYRNVSIEVRVGLVDF
jgi:hypothetical protein